MLVVLIVEGWCNIFDIKVDLFGEVWRIFFVYKIFFEYCNIIYVYVIEIVLKLVYLM